MVGGKWVPLCSDLKIILMISRTGKIFPIFMLWHSSISDIQYLFHAAIKFLDVLKSQPSGKHEMFSVSCAIQLLTVYKQTGFSLDADSGQVDTYLF
jgi:hypothetical protein